MIKRPINFRGRKITINNFSECIPNDQIELVMGKQNAKRFWRWMFGQTAPIGGVYREDLYRWLNGLSNLD